MKDADVAASWQDDDDDADADDYDADVTLRWWWLFFDKDVKDADWWWCQMMSYADVAVITITWGADADISPPIDWFSADDDFSSPFRP